MKILDLFSGAGGLSEGFRNHPSFDLISHIEKDTKACLTLKTREVFHYLKSTNNLDPYNKYLNKEITRKKLYSMVPYDLNSSVLQIEINENNQEKIFNYVDNKLGQSSIDGIIGGPPCQAYSTVGRIKNKSKKISDERIYLYKYYIQFLKKYRPKFFLFENVKGLLSFKDFYGLDLLPQIITELESAGYSVNIQVINTADYGISQRRERLFIFGLREDISVNKDYFDLLKYEQEEPISIFELFKDLPQIKAGDSDKNYSNNNISKKVAKYIRNINYDFPLSQHISRPNNENDLDIYKLVIQEKIKGNNIKYTEIPSCFQTHNNKLSFIDRYKAIDGNSLSHTIVAHIAKDGHYYIHPDVNQNRSLSIRESARIQGFPDDYFFEDSRTSAFKQIGNAVPPILSKKMASAINNFFNI